ncbi:11217_t:CDS:2, partial [Racocetra persica]
PGKNFAMSTLKLLTALLFRRFDIELADKKAPLKTSFTMVRHCDELQVYIRPKIPIAGQDKCIFLEKHLIQEIKKVRFIKSPKHCRNQNNNNNAQFYKKHTSVPYWKPFDFPTIDTSQVQSWSSSQLITHLRIMFTTQGYFKRDLWTESLSQKFVSQQIDGKKLLKMDRDDLIRIIGCADGVKRLIIWMLEGEVIRLNGRYENEIYHDPV